MDDESNHACPFCGSKEIAARDWARDPETAHVRWARGDGSREALEVLGRLLSGEAAEMPVRCMRCGASLVARVTLLVGALDRPLAFWHLKHGSSSPRIAFQILPIEQ